MPNDVWSVEYAGHELKYSFLFDETRRYFGEYASPAEGECDICLSRELFSRARAQLPGESSDGYVEFIALIALTAERLLSYNCCVFHATAFIFHGRAWLLTGPSGVGKTTQFANWQTAHPGEIRMLCGDKPIVELRPDGTAAVHSSPWNGKERVGRRGISLPLGGIVLLEQAGGNVIERVSPAFCAARLFRQFLMRPETEAEAEAMARILDGMLKCAPVWRLRNRGDAASTELMREELIKSAETFLGGGHVL